MQNDDAAESESAGVRFPPPLVLGGALALGLGLGRPATSERGRTVSRALASGAIPGGALLVAWAVRSIKRAGTNVNPFAATTALVTSGPFRFTRNPIYVGGTSVYIGVAWLAQSVPALILLPIALALLDSGVVDREERYLERRFGDAYRNYRQTVPRWF